jgi:drug/metabolite transporter (DMT)-like permease
MTIATPRPGLGLLLAITGAAAFSGKAIIVKLAYRHGTDPMTLLMLRMLLALPLFMLMAWWGGRGKPPLTRRQAWGVLGLGFCGYYLASYLDFWGLQYISASLERLILYLNPTLVAVLGWLLHRKRLSAQQALGMAISYAGIVLVFGHEWQAQGAHATLGAVLVFGSASAYAVYLLYSGRMLQHLGALRLVGLASTVASVFCFIQFALLRPWSDAWVGPEVLGLSLLNATVCTVLPVLLVMMAIERLGPVLAAQAGMIGPMCTLLLGALLLDEPLTLWVLSGTALVLAGVTWATRPSRSAN